MNFLICLLSVSLLSFSALAEDARTWSASVGAGFIVKRNLRVGNTYEDMDKSIIAKAIPAIQLSAGRISLGPKGLSFMALGNRMMSLSASINKAGDRYHGFGMTPRKDSFFAGISAKFFYYSLSIDHDINGRSKGYSARFSYAKIFNLSSEFVVRTSVGLEWFDDHYAEYYYSVKATEVTAGRHEYHLNNFLQPGISIAPIYSLTPSISLGSMLGIKLVPADVRKSPTMNGEQFDLSGLLSLSFQL